MQKFENKCTAVRTSLAGRPGRKRGGNVEGQRENAGEQCRIVPGRSKEDEPQISQSEETH